MLCHWALQHHQCRHVWASPVQTSSFISSQQSQLLRNLSCLPLVKAARPSVLDRPGGAPAERYLSKPRSKALDKVL